MCGINGWHFQGRGPDVVTRVKLAVLLAQGSDERGGQSWGFWTRAGVVRGLGGLVSGINGGLCGANEMFAHSRWATHGAKEKLENAHPFKVGHIIGAHNGIIYNHEDLNKKHGREFEVDSMHIFAHVAEQKDLTELTGYGAVEFFDEQQGMVKLARLTKTGDLHIARVRLYRDPSVTGLVWASSSSALRDTLKGTGFKLESMWEAKVGRLYFPRDGTLYYEKKVKFAITPSQMTSSATSGGSRLLGRYMGWADGEDWYSGPTSYRSSEPDPCEECGWRYTHYTDCPNASAQSGLNNNGINHQGVLEARRKSGKTYADEDALYELLADEYEEKERGGPMYYALLEDTLSTVERGHYDAVMSGAYKPDEDFRECVEALRDMRRVLADGLVEYNEPKLVRQETTQGRSKVITLMPENKKESA